MDKDEEEEEEEEVKNSYNTQSVLIVLLKRIR